MMNSVKLTSKSDIVSFIVFKRQLKKQLHNFLMCIYFVLVVALIVLSIYHKDKIIFVCDKIANTTTSFVDYLFKTKIEKISIHLQENSLLDKDEINGLVKQISNKTITRQQLMLTLDNIKKQNSLIENISARKTLINGNLTLYVKEKDIIAVFIPDSCNTDAFCQKKMILKDNSFIAYHHTNGVNNLLKVYGDAKDADISLLYKLLNKYNLFEKVRAVKFYSCGRFELTLTNDLVVKFPRNNWEKTMKRFSKIDNEYVFSTGHQNITYIDLRVEDKIFVGEK